jgi:hypothetical protein
LKEDSSELLTECEADEEVDGGIGNEREVTEACQAKNPRRRHELRATSK